MVAEPIFYKLRLEGDLQAEILLSLSDPYMGIAQ
jgi:hypothetical protein